MYSGTVYAQMRDSICVTAAPNAPWASNRCGTVYAWINQASTGLYHWLSTLTLTRNVLKSIFYIENHEDVK